MPGLILQVQINDRVLVVATKIEQLKTNPKIKKPDQGEVMNTRDFLAFRKELNKPRIVTTPDGREIRISNDKQ